MVDAYKPEYPAILLKTTWDKKKSVAAKAAGKTGIGEQMLKVKATYDKIDWEAADVEFQTVHNSGQLYSQEWLDKAVATANAMYASGTIRKWVQELYELRDLADAAEKKFSKAALIPKSDTKLAKEISTTADHLGVANNSNSYGPRCKAQIKAAEEWHTDKIKKITGPAVTTLKKAVAKMPGVIKEMESLQQQRADATDEGERHKLTLSLSNVLYTGSRDITQNVINIQKGVKVGVDYGFDTTNLIELGKELVPWANAKSGIFTDESKDSDMANDVKKFKKTVKAIHDIIK